MTVIESDHAITHRKFFFLDNGGYQLPECSIGKPFIAAVLPYPDRGRLGGDCN